MRGLVLSQLAPPFFVLYLRLVRLRCSREAFGTDTVGLVESNIPLARKVAHVPSTRFEKVLHFLPCLLEMFQLFGGRVVLEEHDQVVTHWRGFGKQLGPNGFPLLRTEIKGVSLSLLVVVRLEHVGMVFPIPKSRVRQRR